MASEEDTKSMRDDENPKEGELDEKTQMDDSSTPSTSTSSSSASLTQIPSSSSSSSTLRSFTKPLRVTKNTKKRTREDAQLGEDVFSDASIPTGKTIEESETRIKLSLLKLHDSTSLNELDQQLATTVELIRNDIPSYSQFLSDHIIHSILSLPTHTAVFATLIGLLNVEESLQPYVATFIQRVINDLTTTLQHGRYTEAKLFLRFIGSLVNAHVISFADMKSIMNQLLTVVENTSSNDDMNIGNISQLHRSWLLYTIIMTLPYMNTAVDDDTWNTWCGILDTQCANRQSDLSLQMLRVFPYTPSDDTSANDSADTIPDTTNDVTKSSTTLNEHRIMNLWNAVKELHSTQWKSCDALILPHTHFTNTLLSSTIHSLNYLAPFTLPSFSLISPAQIIPDLHLFAAPELQISNINRLLVTDYMQDSLYAYQPLHKVVTRQLLNSPFLFPTSHLILETILSNLFSLRTPPEQLHLRLPYLAQITANIFKTQPQQMPRMFGQMINMLFQRMNELDIEVRDRLAYYFSFHLSNFAYAWPWLAWQQVLDEDPHSAKQEFVRECLTRLVRLSYWERVVQSLPEEFIVLMPHMAKPAFRFSEKNVVHLPDGVTWYQHANKLIEQLRARVEPHVLLQYLVDEVSTTLGPQASLRLLLPCLLENGNKSFSHIFALLDRYDFTIRTLAEGDEFASQMIVHVVAEYWQHSTQHTLIIINRLLRMGLTDAESIIAWAFSQLHTPVAFSTHLWHLIHETLHTVLVIQPALAAASTALNAEGAGDDAEMKSAEADTDATAHERTKQLALANATAETAMAIPISNEQHVDIIVFLLLQFRALLAKVHGNNALSDVIAARLQEIARSYYRYIELYAESIDSNVTTEDSIVDEQEENFSEEARTDAKRRINVILGRAIS